MAPQFDRALRDLLRAAGCTLVRQGRGSHEICDLSISFLLRKGGLVSHGSDYLEQMREAVSYVDRILRGANPGELLVQLPTKFQLAINLKTARRACRMPSLLL
jgi:hypothetical protein